MEEDSAASMSASRLTLRSWWEELAPDLFIPRSSEPDGQPPAGVSVSQPDSLLLSVSRRAMACEFEVLLNRGQFDNDVSRCVEALDKIEHLEHLLSVYKPRSDLSQVNRWGSGRSVPVEFETMQLLRLARDMHRLTSGAFDLTAGSLSEAWGFARRQGKMPTEAEIAQALGVVLERALHSTGPRDICWSTGSMPLCCMEAPAPSWREAIGSCKRWEGDGWSP